VKKRILARQWFRSVDGLNTIVGLEAMSFIRTLVDQGRCRWPDPIYRGHVKSMVSRLESTALYK
jgi:hypothetical protein